MKFLELANDCINNFSNLFLGRKLIVIANTQNDTYNSCDFDIDNADKTEFFTELEFLQISQALNKLEVYVQYYFNELLFINDILNKKLPIKNILVFNLARNGKHQGKKSLIPAFCDLMKIPYTGSDAFTISLCRNKFVFTKYLNNCGIKMPDTYALSPNGEWLSETPVSEYILKPMAESGSIGVNGKTFGNKIAIKGKECFVNNYPVILQECLNGCEYEVPVFEQNGEYYVLPPTKLKMNNNQCINCLNENYSKENAYSYVLANLSEYEINYMTQTAEKVAKLLNIRNYGRIDFKYHKSKEFPYIIDIACSPYLTKNSSFAYFFQNNNLDYSDIFRIVLSLSFSQKIEGQKE